MHSSCGGGVRRRGISAWVLGSVTVMVACAMGGVVAGAQVSHDTGTAVGAKTATKAEAKSYETLYLNSTTSRSDAYDIVTDLRNMLPMAKVFYVPSQKAISLDADANDLAMAKQVLMGVDRPVKSYKVTYTLTETGGSHAPRTRHVAMLVASGGAAEVKQGDRMPIATGAAGSGDKAETQFQYIDLGLAIRAKLSGGPGHLALDSRVQESRVAGEQTIAGVQEPVIEQTTLTGTSTLAESKTVSLGSMDIPAKGAAGAEHVVVTVMVEPVG